MDNIAIRKAGLADASVLQQISRQTFYETFAASNSEANMTQYLDQQFAIEKLEAELTNTSSTFYFACLNDLVVGYLKLNTGTAQTEEQGAHALEIERIYVLQALHGKKVGQLLYEKAIQVAQEKQVQFVWLGVWENNIRAIRFYEKNGFVTFDKHIFRLGDDEQTDLLMKKSIVS